MTPPQFKEGDIIAMKNSPENTGRVLTHYYYGGLLMVQVIWDGLDMDNSVYDYPATMLQDAYNGVQLMVKLL